MSKLKAYILNRFAEFNPNYTSWMHGSPFECCVVDEFSNTWQPPADAGIVITHMHYRWEEISALRRIYEEGRVPVLILSDGILEYRNTWENPGVPDGALFQPLFGHKLACIGRSQARTAESWGNVGKCEVVGLPRFDQVQASEYLPVQDEGPFRLLVATANTPAFTAEQRNKVVESLNTVKIRCQKNPWVNGRPLEVTWRLTDGLQEEIGLEYTELPHQRVPITDAIELSDAVITTPSTLYLESVMKRRPTAILDFSNSPMYVSSAWTISAPAHLNPVLDGLENPTPAKMLFQRAVLHDNLETGVSSTSRIRSLINAMMKAGAAAKEFNTPIVLPPRILSDSQRGIQMVEAEFDLTSLYRDNPAFKITNVERLQQELNQAKTRLGQLPEDLDTKHIGNQILAQQLELSEERIREGLDREQEHLAAIDEKSEIIAIKSTHIDSLDQLILESNERAKQLHERIQSQTETIQALMDARLEIKLSLDEAAQQAAKQAKQFNERISQQTETIETLMGSRVKLKAALDSSLENNEQIMLHLADVKRRLVVATQPVVVTTRSRDDYFTGIANDSLKGTVEPAILGSEPVPAAAIGVDAMEEKGKAISVPIGAAPTETKQVVVGIVAPNAPVELATSSIACEQLQVPAQEAQVNRAAINAIIPSTSSAKVDPKSNTESNTESNTALEPSTQKAA